MQDDQPIQTPPLDQAPLVPPIPPEPPKKPFKVLIILVVLTTLGLLGGLGYLGYRSYIASQKTKSLDTTPELTQAVNTPTPNSDPIASWEEKRFEYFDLTFKTSPNLLVEESEPTPNKFIGYIQNDKTGQEFFQMYFMYQVGGAIVKQSDIEVLKNDPTFIVPGTARNTSIDGFNGFAGQLAGKEGKFVTAIVKNGYWLIIYTVEPTQANKELSDRIMSTFNFTD